MKRELADAGLKEIHLRIPKFLCGHQREADGLGLYPIYGERGQEPGAVGEFSPVYLPHRGSGGIYHPKPSLPGPEGGICCHAGTGNREIFRREPVFSREHILPALAGALTGAVLAGGSGSGGFCRHDACVGDIYGGLHAGSRGCPCGNSEDSVLRLCLRTEIERDIWNGSE